MHIKTEKNEITSVEMRRVRGYIHSHEEAMLVMHAVRLKLFQPAKERPSMEERESIASGSIYCFMESEDGMKRWTDGKIWSPSKILGHFLLYKEVPRHLSKSALKKEKSEMDRRRRNTFERTRRDYRLDDEFTLYKKTISLEHDGKTYHVISYFQPFFDKRSILSLNFFKDLQECLNINECLLYDKNLYEFFDSNVNLHEVYKLPYPEKNNLIYNIDRTELEKNAISVLRGKLKSSQNRQ
ncbi:Global transcription regulator sge1 [Conglomerata obtusa]